MASLLAAGMQTATWLSTGMGEGGFFSSRLARTRATKHEAAHEETEAVAGTGTAVAACARAVCVTTEHLVDRRKSPVWSTEATYIYWVVRQPHDISTEVFGRAYLEVRAGYFTH
jgi:hypothetical protein